MNKQANVGGKKEWKAWGSWTDTRVHWARTEAEEDRGGRAQRNSGLLCLHTRHWEILKHIQLFTHTDTQGATLLPTAAQTGASQGSLVFSCGPGCGS